MTMDSSQEQPDKWKLVSETRVAGHIRTTRVLCIPENKGCLVHTSTVRDRAEDPLLSEALVFVPNVDLKHFLT